MPPKGLDRKLMKFEFPLGFLGPCRPVNMILYCIYLKQIFSDVPLAKDVFMKSKLSKNRLERNSDTFSGISSAKDVVMKKLLIIQKTSPFCILCEVQLRNDEKMALCLTFISNLIL